MLLIPKIDVKIADANERFSHWECANWCPLTLKEFAVSKFTRWFSALAFLTCVILSSQTVNLAADIPVTIAANLTQGQFAAAEAYLQNRLIAEPKHAQARFALGIVQVLSAVEKLGQDHYRYGAMNVGLRNLPVLRLPVPINPEPETITYQQVRQVFADFQQRLMKAEAELANVDLNQVMTLPIDLTAIRFDLIGEGKSEHQIGFANLFGAINQQRPGNDPPGLSVTFDSGDVLWLRGYCHFLAGFCDIVLAYDHQRLFNQTAQLIYPKHISSEPATEPLDLTQKPDFTRQVIDLITAIHLMNCPLQEPARMASARHHFLEMIRTSRQSWALIQEETDDDSEWLPNSKQTGVLRVPVTREVIEGWHAVLTEMEELLEGRKLIPFWRNFENYFDQNQPLPAETRGVNLKRFFTEPRDFDLILLIQGGGVLPYLERGTLSLPETWENLMQVFRGQFFGFAVWFN